MSSPKFLHPSPTILAAEGRHTNHSSSLFSTCKTISVITDLMLLTLLSSKFHLNSSVVRLRHEQLARYPGLPSAIFILAILSFYRYLVPYVMYFYHETNIKYVLYQLREINDFDLIWFDLNPSQHAGTPSANVKRRANPSAACTGSLPADLWWDSVWCGAKSFYIHRGALALILGTFGADVLL
jgi:hypothetical protein